MGALENLAHGVGSSQDKAPGKSWLPFFGDVPKPSMPDIMNLLGRTGSAGLTFTKDLGGNTSIPETLSDTQEAFTKGLSNEQQDALATEILRQEGLPDTPQTRFMIRMLTDVATYAGGSGGLKRLSMALGDRFLPLLSRVSQVVEKMGPPGQFLAKEMKGAYDFMTFGGPVKRELARTVSPKRGADIYAQALRTRHDIQALPKKEVLKPEFFTKKTVDPGTGIPQGQAYLEAWSQAGPDAKKLGEALSRAQRRNPAAMQRQYPGARLIEGIREGESDIIRRASEGQKGAKVTFERTKVPSITRSPKRDAFMKQFIAQADLPEIPGELRYAGKKGMVPGEDLLSKDLRSFLLSKEPKGSKAGDLWRGFTDIPKAAMVGMSPVRHGINVTTLGAGHYPMALPKAAVTTIQALAKKPEAAREMLSKIAGSSGVLGSAAENTNAFVDWATKIPMAGRAALGGTLGGASQYRTSGGDPKAAVEGALFGAAFGAGAPGLYKLSNRILWTYDDAVKANAARDVAQGYIKKGMAPDLAYAKAGKEVLDRMIGYGDRSPFTQWLANIAWFATWRTKLPGSIMRLITEHPERVLAMQRINPLLTGTQVPTGGTTAQGKPEGKTSYNPVAEFMRGAQNPPEYARGTLSPVAKGIGGVAYNTIQGEGKHASADEIMESLFKRPPKKRGQIDEPWLTSYAPPVPYALSGELGTFADPTGLTPFAQQSPWDTFLQSQTGVYSGAMKP